MLAHLLHLLHLLVFVALAGPNGARIEGSSTTTPLGAAATWTGDWMLVDDAGTIAITASADVASTLYVDFSHNGSDDVRTVQLSDGDDGSMGLHTLTPFSRFARVRVVNGATEQGSLVVETILHTGVKQIYTRAAQALDDYSPVLAVRAVTEPMLDEARGAQADRVVVHKFGRNASVEASTEEDIWIGGGIYTGWLTSAASIRVAAGGDADDDAAGTGAQSIWVVGLDETWSAASEEIATNGTSASTGTTTTFLRVFRAYTGDVGTYGGANAAPITLETTGGTTVAVIGANTQTNGRGLGQTQLGLYTVPAGQVGYARRVAAQVGGNKSAGIYCYQRQNAEDVTTPYTGARLWHTYSTLEGNAETHFASYVGPFPSRTDVWCSATGPSGGADVSVEFDLVLINE